MKRWLLKEKQTQVWDTPVATVNAVYALLNSGPGIGATCAIRSGDWKLVYYFDSGKRELFNIPNDISEKHDLAAQKPRIVKQLAGKLSNYLRSVNAQRPTLRATQQPAPWPDEIK